MTKVNSKKKKKPVVDKSDVTVINDWANAGAYEKRYFKHADKNQVWQYKQNNPELVVKDLILVMKVHGFLDVDDAAKERELTDIFYSILLIRGVNKWLFIRRLLIRLKKVYCNKLKSLELELEQLREEYKQGGGNRGAYRDFMIKKGEMRAYNQVRNDLKTLCMGPRWVIWNYKEPGLFDTIGMKPAYRKSFKRLFHELWDSRFTK